MRLQLTLLVLLLAVCPKQLQAQSANRQGSSELTSAPSLEIEKKDTVQSPTEGLADVEIDFLSSYYSQEGRHAAVTGGLGDESLQDFSSILTVFVPLDTLSTLTVSGGINYYTSASTDKIDIDVSSASRHDIRGQFYITYGRSASQGKQAYDFTLGGSSESDYLSTSLGASWSWLSENENRELGIGAQAFFDRWLLIFPEELRGDARATQVPTDRRHTYALSLSYSQVISPRLQVALSTDFVHQSGLLSTPFHRVYFQGEDLPRIERLPQKRYKWPIGFRLNYFLNDLLVLRGYYRFYTDNFGILAHTTELELPLKLGLYASLYPFYRFHTQGAARYFQPFGQHRPFPNFYTSDFDLSAFHSHKMGLGFRYSPLYGLGRFKLFSQHRVTMFKSVEVRYAHYDRSDGLRANVFSLLAKFLIPN